MEQIAWPPPSECARCKSTDLVLTVCGAQAGVRMILQCRKCGWQACTEPRPVGK